MGVARFSIDDDDLLWTHTIKLEPPLQRCLCACIVNPAPTCPSESLTEMYCSSWIWRCPLSIHAQAHLHSKLPDLLISKSKSSSCLIKVCSGSFFPWGIALVWQCQINYMQAGGFLFSYFFWNCIFFSDGSVVKPLLMQANVVGLADKQDNNVIKANLF